MKFSKNKEARIDNKGYIKEWPDMSLNDMIRYSFVGLSKNKKGDYSFTRSEMIENKVTGNFYPVLCDGKGNFLISKNQILEIEYWL